MGVQQKVLPFPKTGSVRYRLERVSCLILADQTFAQSCLLLV
jgi:hypothetical protein